jgi:hypothetical protein
VIIAHLVGESLQSTLEARGRFSGRCCAADAKESRHDFSRSSRFGPRPRRVRLGFAFAAPYRDSGDYGWGGAYAPYYGSFGYGYAPSFFGRHRASGLGHGFHGGGAHFASGNFGHMGFGGGHMGGFGGGHVGGFGGGHFGGGHIR